MARTTIAVLAVIAALVTGCGSGAGADSAEVIAGVPAELQFTATTIGGQQFAGDSLAGKPAVLWFWAPWCPVCQRESPAVGKTAAAHPDVTFLGVAGLDQVPAMQHFVDKYPVKDFTQLADTDGAIWRKFGVTQQPAYAFIDSAGKVDVVKGGLAEQELTERVAALSHR